MMKKHIKFVKWLVFKLLAFTIILFLFLLTALVLSTDTDGRRQIVDEDGGQEVIKPLIKCPIIFMEECVYE